MAQQPEDHRDVSCVFWWTHRDLMEEATSLLTSSTVEELIHISIEEIKAKARVWIEMAMVSNNDKVKECNELVDIKKRIMCHEELVALRNKLLEGLITSQHEQQEVFTEETIYKECVVDKQNMSMLRRTAHEMLLNAVFSEWAIQWTTKKDTDSSKITYPSCEYLVDIFLDDMAFTYVSKWSNEVEEESAVIRDVVWSFVTDTLGMSHFEQERLLPRLTQHIWEDFLQELQNVEKEVLCVCENESSGVMLTLQERQNLAFTLVTRVIRLLKMLAIPSTISDVAVNRTDLRGHVVLTTSVKAQTIVQSMNRWLPVCGDFLYSLTPQQHVEKKMKTAMVGNGDDGPHKDGDTIDTTPEALEWIRRLKLHVQRILPLLAELDETSPWIVMLADIIACTFYRTNNTTTPFDNDYNNNTNKDENVEVKRHVALKNFLMWYSTAEEASTTTSTTTTTTVGSISQRSLAKVCSMKMSHVLSSVLDKESPPSSLNTRILRVLLVQRPIATLRHFLGFLCPISSVEAFCDYEAAITNKGRASELRSTAFKEDPLGENAVAWTFFPKYFAVFRAVEEALVSLCRELMSNSAMSTDAASLVLERFIAAALDECFTNFAHNNGTAASEWLMFLAFVCSETPMFEVSALHHIRNAARRFFAPGKLMMSYLYQHIVQLGQHGLVAFFLPPLRAIGIDYSTASDHEHISCALCYPLSAEVAYFQELPHGYYCRQPLRLALNAKNDALHFFHELIMPPLSLESAKKFSLLGGTSKENEKDKTVTRSLFVDIVAHVGVLVSARVRGDADRRAVTDPSTVDAMSSFFFGILRLCSSVVYWDDARRHKIQRAILRELCMLNRAGLSHSMCTVNTNNNNNAVNSKQITTPFPMAFLLRGGCTLDDAEVEMSTTNCEDVPPHAWLDWFLSAEFEDIDSRAVACAMALLRFCNRNYMKSIPTRTLLARRGTLEQHAVKEKELSSQAQATTAMRAAILRDVDMLRKERRGKETARANQKQEGEFSLKEKIVAVNDNAAKANVETGNVEFVSPTRSNEVEDGNSKQKKENEEDIHFYEKPLSLSVVKIYVESVVSTLIQRARMSIVDGVAAGVALRKWLENVSGKFEPQALLETVRHVVLQANTKLTHATKLECASLSAFLGVIADDIALPYKLSFFTSRHARMRQHLQIPPTNEVMEDYKSYEWLRQTLPSSEKDAVMLLRVLIADTTRAVTRFLEHGTPLGDWKAYILTFHLQRIMGLVKQYEDSFRTALAKRQQQIGTNALTKEGTHPIQLLNAIQFPLLPNMVAAAADVDHLFTSASSTLPNSSSLLPSSSTLGMQKSPVPTTMEGNGGRRGWVESGDTFRQKRYRSTERHYSYRRDRKRNGFRNHID